MSVFARMERDHNHPGWGIVCAILLLVVMAGARL